MSLPCSDCRARLMAIAAGRADEADRLEVEIHLSSCAACHEEQARWQVVQTLGAWEPSLTPAARDRVREAVLRAAASEAAARRKAPERRAALWWAMPVAAALALVAGIGAWKLRGGSEPSARVVSGLLRVDGAERAVGTAIAPDAKIEAGAGGAVVRLDGPSVELAAGTSAGWSLGDRTLRMTAGEVLVDVNPGQGRRFRVATDKFIVEVVGTRFVVRLDGVRTERGKVRVLSLDGRELARVSAGESWSVPSATPSGASRDAAPQQDKVAVQQDMVAPRQNEIAAQHVDAPAPTAPAAPTKPDAPQRHASQPARSSVRADASTDLIEEARKALAAGDANRTRALVAQVIALHPAAATDAEARSLSAEAFLVEGRKQEARRAYLDVARAHPRGAAAESALFAAAQLALEMNRLGDARRGFADYLGRFPHGRFRAEAREHLQRLQSP